jgi:hypothetical protein
MCLRFNMCLSPFNAIHRTGTFNIPHVASSLQNRKSKTTRELAAHDQNIMDVMPEPATDIRTMMDMHAALRSGAGPRQCRDDHSSPSS